MQWAHPGGRGGFGALRSPPPGRVADSGGWAPALGSLGSVVDVLAGSGQRPLRSEIFWASGAEGAGVAGDGS